MEIIIFENKDSLAKNAAELICDIINESINEKGRAVISLCGGNSPGPVYEKLSQEKIDWNKVFFFWGDERNEPPGSEESNYYTAYLSILSKIEIPHENVYRIESEKEPEEAASIYNNKLIEFFNDTIPSFDLMLLGIGEDGHTASLFPDTDALKVKDKYAVINFVPKLNKYRITLTMPVINNSENIIFLVSGENKSDIIKKIFKDEDNNLPASKVLSEKGLTFLLLDRDAAKMI